MGSQAFATNALFIFGFRFGQINDKKITRRIRFRKVSPNGARGTSASESARTYLPLKLASLAALLGAFMSLALVSVSACLVGVRANPSAPLTCSSPPMARDSSGARPKNETNEFP